MALRVNPASGKLELVLGSPTANAFNLVQTPSGTSPTASGATTLTLASADNSVAMVGNSGTNTVDFSSAIIDSASLASPQLVSTAITLLAKNRLRVFVAGNAAPSLNPTLPTGSGTRELILFGCDSTNTVTLNSASNLKLSGQWVGRLNSVLSLFWDGSSKWVECHRNEI